MVTVIAINESSTDLLNCVVSKSPRDTPDSFPSFVGENEAKKGYTITQMGNNVFAAVL